MVPTSLDQMHGSQVPSQLTVCYSKHLQSLQSSQCPSQFTPPEALRKFLQKQPGEYNALSGEHLDLSKKDIFCCIPKYQLPRSLVSLP